MNVGIYSRNINKIPQKNGYCIYVPVLHLLSVKSWVEFVWNVPRAKILFTSTFNRAEFPVSRGCLVRTTNYIWTCPNCSEIGVLIPRWFHCFEHFNKYNANYYLPIWAETSFMHAICTNCSSFPIMNTRIQISR